MYIIDHHFLLTLHWLGNRIFKYLMWSQINVRSSIRLTVSQQIDFKVFKPFEGQNILES
jgi:hypothetical protein